MADLKGVVAWVEAHPTESIVIGAGGTIALLWLLGFFSSASSSSSGASNLAAAYYAAEAQQAVVGGQIQQTTLNDAAATAINAAQVNGATAIAATQATAATTINGQNATAATTINADQVNGATSLGLGVSNDQLLATYSNNSTAQAMNASNNAAATQINQDQVNGSIFSRYLGSVAAPELMMGILPDATVPGVGGASMNFGTSGPVAGTPSWFQSVGYNPAQIAAIFG